MQFGHAVGLGALEAQDHDHVAEQLAVLEGLQRVFLGFEDGGGRLDDTVLGLHGRNLDDRAAQVALDQAQAPLMVEGVGGGAQDVAIQALADPVAPHQFAVHHGRLLEIGLDPLAHDGGDIGVDVAGLGQFARDEGHAAGGLEGVHIGRAVGIDAREQRRDRRQFVHVGPVDQHPRRPRHGDQVDGVVGGAPGGQKGHDHVDDGLLVDDVGHAALAAARQFDGPLRRRRRQGVAQTGVGMDKGGGRHVQPAQLHHHLVGVGGAVEGAGAGRVIAADLAFQQGLTINLVLRIFGADAGFFRIRNARRHGAGRGEDDGQVTEGQGAHEQAGHDLVADAQHQARVEGVMGQGHARRHGDDVAAEQRQLHAWAALGHAVAHGGRAAGDLGRGADLAHRRAHDVGETLERLMGRQHVVIGRDDAQVRLGPVHRRQLVGDGLAREGVRPVGAGQFGAPGPAVAGGVHATDIVGAGLAAFFDDAGGDRGDRRMKRHQPSSVHKTSRGTPAAIRAAMGWILGSPMACSSKTRRLAAPFRPRITRLADIR